MASQDTATSTTADDVEMMDSQVSDTQREPVLKSDDEDENVGARSGSSLGGFWDIQGWNPGESPSLPYNYGLNDGFDTVLGAR
jgi:hypothetical protein